jgi:hypothetical protein
MNTHFFLCFIWMAGILEINLQFAVFFYKNLSCSAGVLSEPESDWDQKGSATIHTKSSKGPQKTPKRPLFWHFVWEIVKSPCDQCCIASMTSPPLSLKLKHNMFVRLIWILMMLEKTVRSLSLSAKGTFLRLDFE